MILTPVSTSQDGIVRLQQGHRFYNSEINKGPEQSNRHQMLSKTRKTVTDSMKKMHQGRRFPTTMRYLIRRINERVIFQIQT